MPSKMTMMMIIMMNVLPDCAAQPFVSCVVLPLLFCYGCCRGWCDELGKKQTRKEKTDCKAVFYKLHRASKRRKGRINRKSQATPILCKPVHVRTASSSGSCQGSWSVLMIAVRHSGCCLFRTESHDTTQVLLKKGNSNSRCV
ncbi:hypothetical protein LZ30DRAFT_114817 [Colletotrichum cereale]|nr:hypothetical protein LZ30DRAFT_114817 [Colletotrichum cereale]